MISRRMIFLYGPPGSGKTTLGSCLAGNLDLPFFDLDAEIEAASGLDIPEIFAKEGEACFRQREFAALQTILEQSGKAASRGCVVALGGGALTAPETRRLAEQNGAILSLTAAYPVLLSRLQAAAPQSEQKNSAVRPLLAGDLPGRLAALMEQRKDHYASFPLILDTGATSAQESAWQAGVKLGWYRVKGMGQPYDVLVQDKGLASLGDALQSYSLRGPAALVTDENVAAHYGAQAIDSLSAAGFTASKLEIPAGEAFKTIQTVQNLWSSFISVGIERGSTVLALGGGVVGDLAGFAAATYLRGVRWVNLPTTLLAMVDASLGGKTGADLPQGKNLVGAFHPPALVLADPLTLRSLPKAELRSGLAEVIKHGIIGDPELFELACSPSPTNLGQIVRRAMSVKVRIIEADPYERGLRAALNLGHTVGHAVEQVSGYHLRHGEAVAIGMVAEARLAERLGIAQVGLAETIATTLAGVGLPVAIPPPMDRGAILQTMQVDKKRAGGKIRFALPVKIGEVVTGVEVTDFDWLEAV
jgi:3-dehydroquinate synthase